MTLALRYDVDLGPLGPFASRFVALEQDEATQAWIAEMAQRPHSRVATWLVDQASRFMSSYDAHGLFGTYAMHLLSEAQWGTLVGQRRAALLDVGAGAGYVTQNAKAWFERIVCTETSRKLAERLAQRGFECLTHDITEAPLPVDARFDIISCLNVIDRTAYPVKLLQALRALVHDGNARLLLAVPLPLRPHVHVPGGTVSPVEMLPMREQSFEGALREMSEFLEAQGFLVERICRVPYLSRGDAYAPIYELDDALWLLKRV